MDTPTVVAFIAAGVALIGHFVKQHVDRRAELLKEQQAKKVPIYTELLDLTQAALLASEANAGPARNVQLTTKVITWAPVPVVLAYTDVWQKLEARQTTRDELESAVGKLLFAIRQDLGHDDKREGDPLKFALLTARLYLHGRGSDDSSHTTRQPS